jgi:PAS domain S-box-containing protein
MQHDLKILEQRWGMALQSAGFGVWDLDLPNEQVHYSPEWKAMLGYEDSPWADRTAVWRSRVHPDDLRPMIDALSGHLSGRSAQYEKEFRLRAADGRYLWVLSRGRVVQRDAEGRPLRMVGTLTDMTDRREAESLRRERDHAEAASRAKTQFLSRMSHELRTPLNAVLGFAQLLKARIGSADVEMQRGFVAEIEKAGWHLLTLIDDVLDLARGEGGQLDIQAEPVTLVPLLEAAIQIAAPAARARGIEIHLRAPDLSEAWALADAQRLQQVIDKLLGNAIKFNRDGGTVTLDVTAGEGQWEVSVTDTGIGIRAQQLPYVFEPFNRQGHAASASDGVGVGLMLARWLIEAMGGSLTVRSVEGVGSTFTVTLPAQGRAVDRAVAA